MKTDLHCIDLPGGAQVRLRRSLVRKNHLVVFVYRDHLPPRLRTVSDRYVFDPDDMAGALRKFNQMVKRWAPSSYTPPPTPAGYGRF